MEREGKVPVTPAAIDVLCGSGQAVLSHPGNLRLKRIIEGSVDAYLNASCKAKKSDVVRSIVREIGRQTRVLKRDPIFPIWHAVSPNDTQKVLRDKITSCLRNISKKRGNDEAAAPLDQGKQENDRSIEVLANSTSEEFIGCEDEVPILQQQQHQPHQQQALSDLAMLGLAFELAANNANTETLGGAWERAVAQEQRLNDIMVDCILSQNVSNELNAQVSPNTMAHQRPLMQTPDSSSFVQSNHASGGQLQVPDDNGVLTANITNGLDYFDQYVKHMRSSWQDPAVKPISALTQSERNVLLLQRPENQSVLLQSSGGAIGNTIAGNIRDYYPTISNSSYVVQLSPWHNATNNLGNIINQLGLLSPDQRHGYSVGV